MRSPPTPSLDAPASMSGRATGNFPAGSHVLFYRAEESCINVVRILRARMDVDRQLEFPLVADRHRASTTSTTGVLPPLFSRQTRNRPQATTIAAPVSTVGGGRSPKTIRPAPTIQRS